VSGVGFPTEIDSLTEIGFLTGIDSGDPSWRRARQSLPVRDLRRRKNGNDENGNKGK